MYPRLTLNRGSYYPSFHQQPLPNPIEINRILPDSNEFGQAKLGDRHISSLSNDYLNITNVPNSTTRAERSSRKRPANSYATRFGNPDRFLPPQPSVEIILQKRLTPLIGSQLNGILNDRIQRERRAHTMAPLAHISGPSSTPQAKMFATTAAPADNTANKSQHFAQQFSRISHGRSDIEIIDEDPPIIVKVRYDPQTGGRPTEDAVRKALNQQRFDQKTRKEPIVLNFSEQRNAHPQIRQNPLPTRITLPRSRPLPSVPHPFLRNRSVQAVHTSKPAVNQPPQLSNRHKNSTRTGRVHPTGFNQFKAIHQEMAAQQSSAYLNDQQLRPNSGPSSGEVFRPPAVTDIPELSRENLLNMLNQIPDLQGRQFNIEYAPPTAPDGYPFPSHSDMTSSAYPDPVVIDRLPSNIIQHVKSSNNPALTAALEATIQREQSTVSSFNVQPAAVVHHAAQPYQQVQQSRPVSSDESGSSTEVSSSETSSSEETDSEESEGLSTAQSGNHPSFIGPIPPASHS